MTSSSTQFYFSSYFIVNSFLLFAYPLLRLFTSAGRKNLKQQDYFGFSYENSIIYTVLLMAVMGYARSTSLRGFLADLFSVGKVGVAALLVFAKFKFSIIYSVVCLVLWMVTPYPKYIAPNKFVRIKSVQQFDELINNFKTSTQIKISKKGKKHQQEQQNPFKYQDKWMYFIEFYAEWVLPCTLGKEIWYKYSLTYQTQRLKFLQVNVTKFPELAKRYKINTSGFSKQLPTVVIISNGEEQMRFPPIDQNNKVKKVIKLDYKILLHYFDLESRYLQTRQFGSKHQKQRKQQENKNKNQ